MLSATIKILISFLENTRRIGKTSSTIDLAKRSNSIFIGLNRTQLNEIIKNNPNLKTLSHEEIFLLRGNTAPIVVDPDVYLFLLRELLKEYETLCVEFETLYKHHKKVSEEFFLNLKNEDKLSLGLTHPDPIIRETISHFIKNNESN